MSVDGEDARGVGGEVEGLGGAGLSVDGGGDGGLRLTGEFPGNLEVDLAAGGCEEWGGWGGAARSKLAGLGY